MTPQQRSDIEDLRLLERWVDAHRARGTVPHPASYARYVALLVRVAMAREVAA